MDVIYVGDYAETNQGVLFHDLMVDKGIVTGEILDCVDDVNQNVLCIIFNDWESILEIDCIEKFKKRTTKIFEVKITSQTYTQGIVGVDSIWFLDDDIDSALEILYLQLLCNENLPSFLAEVKLFPIEFSILKSLYLFRKSYVQKETLCNILNFSLSELNVYIYNIRKELRKKSIEVLSIQQWFKLVKNDWPADERTMINLIWEKSYKRIYEWKESSNRLWSLRYIAKRKLAPFGIHLLRWDGLDYRWVQISEF